MQQATHRTRGSLGPPGQRKPQQTAADYDKRQDIPDAEQADLVKRQEAPQAVTIYHELFEQDPCREEADEDSRLDQKRQVFERDLAHFMLSLFSRRSGF
jgi:hypothetical protein